MNNITVYTSYTCTHCKALKKYLTEKNIQYIEKNIDNDRQAMAQMIEKGHRSVPVIDINGEEIVGFDKEKIEKLLNL